MVRISLLTFYKHVYEFMLITLGLLLHYSFPRFGFCEVGNNVLEINLFVKSDSIVSSDKSHSLSWPTVKRS
jgi:hypothetical protein